MIDNQFIHDWDCRWLSPGQWRELGSTELECPVCGNSVVYASNVIMYVSVCGGCGAMVGPAEEGPGYVAWYEARASHDLFYAIFNDTHRNN